MKRLSLILLAILPLVFIACGEDPNDPTSPNNGKDGISVSGFAQKGQLIKGSSVTAFGLDENLKATGASFPTSITDDMGSFALDAVGDVQYIEFKAEGYYFVENTGKMSSGPIYLSALAQKGEKDVNINLLTTLTVSRIKFLVSTGMEFAKAKQQAQQEIIRALDINNAEVALVDFNDMNIAHGSEADAVLLATSVLLQAGRSTGDLLAFIAEVSSGFEKTGMISEDTRNAIYAKSKDLPLNSIIDNLIQFYESKGIQDFTIPPFYKYISDSFPELIVYVPQVVSGYLSDKGKSDEFKVLSFVDFTCEADVDWIEVETVTISGNYCLVKYSIKPNPSYRRTGHILFKDKEGKVLKSLEYKQETGLQFIHVEKGYETKSSSVLRSLDVGEKISVNGKIYVLPEDKTVEVESAESYRVGYPETVTGLEDDPYFCTVHFESETTEFYYDYDSVWVGDEQPTYSGLPIPRYGALKPYNGIEIPKYATAYLKPCVACLQIKFSDCEVVGSMVVEGGENAVLSGDASYLYSETVANSDNSYSRHDPIVSNAGNKVKVINSNQDNTMMMVLMPQVLNYIKVSVYDTNGGFLYTREYDLESTGHTMDLRIGGMYYISINKQ